MKIVLPLMFLLMSLASAQTTTTYQSSTGTVSPGNAVTGHLDLGGSFVSPYGMGSGCYYGGMSGLDILEIHAELCAAEWHDGELQQLRRLGEFHQPVRREGAGHCQRL